MKKWSLSHTCAYISLAISITLLVLWCCNVGGFTVVSLDSFVGVIVALLAIVVTLAVGWQIYNSIEIKDKIEKLSILEDKLSKQEETFNQQNCKSQESIYFILGCDSGRDEDYKSAFRFYLFSLEYAMQLKPSSNVGVLLNALEKMVNKIEKGSIETTGNYLYAINKSNNAIKSSSNYFFIKEQYERIYNSFNSKINGQNE